jgi:endonuclease-3
MVATAAAKRYAVRIARLLEREYPEAHCTLDFRNPFELLVATILSAQCTDLRVNIVTKDLFRKYRNPAAFAKVPLSELEQDVKTTGFFRNKAKNIQACARSLVERFGGEVPQDLDELVQLAGVGRKTANVVLGSAFDIASGVVVDTHVTRLSRRLGLTKAENPVKIESDLAQQLPKKEWVAFSHRLIQHGRRVCAARKPKCPACVLSKLCPRIGVAETA